MPHLNRFQRWCIVLGLLAIAFVCVRPPWQVTYCIKAESGGESGCPIVWRPVWDNPREIFLEVFEPRMASVKAEFEKWKQQQKKYNPNWTPSSLDKPQIESPPGMQRLTEVTALATSRLILTCISIAAVCAALCVAASGRRDRPPAESPEAKDEHPPVASFLPGEADA